MALNGSQLGTDIEGGSSNSFFGREVDITGDGTRVIIGAVFFEAVAGDDRGLIQVYDFDGTDWVQVGQNITGVTEDNQIGLSVSINNAMEIL